MTKDIFFLILASQNGFITFREIEELYIRSLGEPDMDLITAVKELMGAKELEITDNLLSMLEIKEAESEETELFSLSLEAAKDHQNLVTETLSAEQPGHYAVLGELGRGGMGRVLVTFDKHIGREVAIKELSTAGAGSVTDDTIDIITNRFLREARITGQLEHPSIVPVHEIGKRKDGTLYYSMKLIKGKTLNRAIKECGTLEEALLLLPHFRDLCHAVSYAHSKGIIHRDIKPSNVMIGEFGETMLLDWGLAKSLSDTHETDKLHKNLVVDDAALGKTVYGRAVGTPAYMAPEQALGKTHEIDKLSDLYSLGAVFYEIITGHPPFEADSTYELLAKVINEPFSPFEEEEFPPPTELQAIASKALSKKKEDRYQTIKAFVHDVEAYMTGEKVHAHTYNASAYLNLFLKQNKLLLSTVIVVFFILLFSLMGIYSQYVKAAESFRNEQIARKTAQASNLKVKYFYSQALYKKAQEQYEIKDYNAASVYAAASLLNNPTYPKNKFYQEAFNKQFPDSHYFKVSALSILYMNTFNMRVVLDQYLDASEFVRGLDVSPDGNFIATGDIGGAVKLWDARNGALKQKFAGHTQSVNAIAFSHDGKQFLSTSSDKTIKLWSVETGDLIRQFEGHQGAVNTVAFTHDGKQFVSGGEDETLMLWDVQRGKIVRKYAGHIDIVATVLITEDKETIISGSFDNTIIQWDLNSGRKIKTFTGHTGLILDLDISSDGKRLVSGSRDHTIKIWDIQSGNVIKTLHDHTDTVYSVSFSKNGKLLASGGFDKLVKLWDLSTNKVIQTIGAHTDGVYNVGFVQHDHKLITSSADGTVKIWDIVTSNKQVTIDAHNYDVLSFAFSPDGRSLVSGSRDSAIKVWNVDNGKLSRKLRGHFNGVFHTSYSPDGTMIASSTFDKKISIWNAETGTEIKQLSGHKDFATWLSFAPDNKRIASAGRDNIIKIWDIKTGKELKTLIGHTNHIYSLIFSPDQKRIISGSFDHHVKVWNLQNGKNIISLENPDIIVGIDQSVDGKYIYAACKDHNVYKWDWQKQKIVKIYKGNKSWVNYVAVSPDGQNLMTIADDYTVRIWDEKSARELLIFSEKKGFAIDWSPDGKTFAFGNRDTIEMWPFVPDLLRRDPQTLLKSLEYSSGLHLDGFQLMVTTKERYED